MKCKLGILFLALLFITVFAVLFSGCSSYLYEETTTETTTAEPVTETDDDDYDNEDYYDSGDDNYSNYYSQYNCR